MDVLQDIAGHYGIFGLLVLMVLNQLMAGAKNRNGHAKLYADIEQLKITLAQVEMRMQAQEQRKIPPEWFEEKVDDLKLSVDRALEHTRRTDRGP